MSTRLETSGLQAELTELSQRLDGELRLDDTHRHIYATDASIYAETPLGVVFPKGRRDLEAILDGGSDRVHAAGASIVGGHSVRDTEVKYGLSVTGVVDPARLQHPLRRVLCAARPLWPTSLVRDVWPARRDRL